MQKIQNVIVYIYIKHAYTKYYKCLQQWTMNPSKMHTYFDLHYILHYILLSYIH